MPRAKTTKAINLIIAFLHVEDFFLKRAVVVDEYPVYAAPRVYAAPVYAYAGPVWRDGWGHRRHFRGRW
jgi:hypothetical protein